MRIHLLSGRRKPQVAATPPAVIDTPPILRSLHSPEALYVIPRLRDQRSGEVLHLDRLSNHYQHATLLGPHGIGKTSALRFLAQRAGTTAISLADHHPNALPLKLLDAGYILLDDVEDSRVHLEYIARLVERFPHAKIFAAVAPGKQLQIEFAPLALQPLNEREIVSFAEAWFPPAKTGHHGVKLANRAVEAFVASIKADLGTRLLATNPLYLFMLLQVYAEPEPRADGNARRVRAHKEAVALQGIAAPSPFDVPVRANISPLPTRRVELMNAYLQARLATESDPEFAGRALEGIGLSTKRGQIAKEEHLPRGYGFLRERASGRVEFVHPVFQDFLTAKALRRNPDFGPMREHLTDEDWREVLVLYSGLGDPSELTEGLLDQGQVHLAALALAEAESVPDGLRDRVIKPLIQQAWQEQDETAVASLGALRSNAVTDFFSARLKDRDPLARARAARILGTLHTDRAIEYLLPQLRDTNADVRDEVVKALGQSKSDRVIEPLLVALRGDARVGTVDTRLRIAAARALGEFGTEKAVPALIVEIQVGEPEVREVAVQALIKIRSELARKPLEALVASTAKDEVRDAAQRVLEAMNGK